MELPLAPEHRVKVGEFQRKHHTRMLALVFTDIVGSTDLKSELGDLPSAARIQKHHAVVRRVLGRFPEGEEINTGGDSFFMIFSKPSDAVKFALLLQAELRADRGHEHSRALMDRIGIHVGEVVIAEGPDGVSDFYGIQVNLCWRIMDLAQGDQILLARAAFDNARQILKGQDLEGIGTLAWRNHGAYRLKGIDDMVEICEVGEEGKALLKPPVDSEKVHRSSSSEGDQVLGWRPGVGLTVPNTQWILEKKLGEGGFGEVWLGRHERLKELRVFKFCFRAERVRSLKREITIFRLLKERVGNRADIVGVQDVCLEQPPFYLVMDYGEGQDLQSWCTAQGGANKIPLVTRLEIAAQVADALQAAHEAGIIHRDVKPSNILVSEGRATSSPKPVPVVKLTDFGIGQVVSKEVLAGLTQDGFTDTATRPQSGTLMYLAPELIAGRPASTQSDIYSLGVVLYQLVIGDFSRPVTTDWRGLVAEPLIAEDLERCFAGDAQGRFARIGELAQRLRTWPERREALARQEAARISKAQILQRRTRTQRLALAASVVVVIAALAGYTYSVIRSDAQHRQHAQNEASRADAAQRQTHEAEQKLAVLDKQLAEALSELQLVQERQGATNVIASTELSIPAPGPNPSTPILQAASPPIGEAPALARETTSSKTPSASAQNLRELEQLKSPSTGGSNNCAALLSVEGTVEIRRAGKGAWERAQPGEPLQATDEVRTGPSSTAKVRLADLTVMRINELTTITLYSASLFHEKVAIREYQIKAAFLLKFLQFTEWPREDRSDAITIGLLGGNPFGSFLEETIRGQKVNGKNVVVKELADVSAGQQCHLIFINGANANELLAQLVQYIDGKPVLTVGEGLLQNVMVRFIMESGRVRLRIDQEAAARAHLKLSTKLLDAASIRG